ncbi:MAG: type VI secretion system tip protein TssI/VgrG [Candidatus Electrothrix scaldis]|nr:MAG: type VI secretion system tip protein TssI/VgrG [Candidatus Electrothrix sp. GW3-3]
MPTDLLTKKKFSFTSKATDDDSFAVVSFTGSEAISQPYEFEIVLVSEKTDIDPLQVLHHSAVFTIHRDKEQDVHFNGIVMQFEETQEFNGYLFFKAVLAPKLRWLALTHHNQVFLDLTIPDIMREALKDAELSEGIDFEFRLQTDYQPIEYVCQYDESHLNFVSRWAEREGIYYFFEQTDQGEKVVFTDTKISQADLALGKDLIYMPQTGLDSLHTKEVIKDFVCKHTLLPERVYLKDYNYRKPSLAMEGIADVDPDGRGENYIYGEQFFTPEEGNHLAKIRAEELLCRKSVFLGGSSVPFMVPGFTFDLQEHYRSIYNRKYLIADVSHEGHQTGYLISGLGPALTPREEQMFYANSFTAIYSDVQFRPVRAAVKPKISGTINAKIDAAASGQYAELDEQGRYKVILPFDRSGRHSGKASAWFRMMQPYAGPNQGMHFPLHKGTEVVLTFIDGDPDRPLIAGAVPNPETASPVTVSNQTKSIIRSGKNPVSQSAGAAFGLDNFADIAEDIADAIEDTVEDFIDAVREPVENYIELEDKENSERIFIHSEGDLWFEAKDRYGEYYAKSKGNTVLAGEETSCSDLLSNFDSNYNPTGMIARHKNDDGDYDDQTSFYDDVFLNAHVKVSSLDTVNTQEGNIYDFGGYWNYNLGNSYEENHMNQDDSVILNNSDLPKDKTNTGGPNYSEIKELPNKSSHRSNVWVEKKLEGASYEYATGHDSLEVNHQCHSVEYKYGGKSEEYGFTGESDGYKKTSKTISGSGKTEEWKYDRSSEALLSYEKEDWKSPSNIHKYSFNACNVASHTFNFSSTQSSEIAVGLAFSLALNVAASTSINIGFALSAELKTGLEMGLELDLRAGGTFELDPSGQLEFNGIGFTARKKAALEAERADLKAKLSSLEMREMKLQLVKQDISLQKHFTWIGDIAIDLRKCQGCIIL